MFPKVSLNVGWAKEVDDDAGPAVEVGSRLVARKVHVHLFGADSQPQVDVLIDSSSGVPRCAEVRFLATDRGPEVRSKDLRLIDLEDLVERIVALFSTSDYTLENGNITAVIGKPDTSSAKFRAAKTTLRDARRATRHVLTDDRLRRVAELYRGDPDRPVKAVELAMGVGRSTAFRYVAEARTRGFLDERNV